MSGPPELDAPARPRGILADPALRAAALGATALIGLFALEYIAVGSAMPTVAESLDGYHLYNMAFGATVAASVIGMIVGGWWSDRSGPRPVVHVGTLGFALGLAVAGLAPTMEVFVVGRGVQGLGSGLATVALYVVIAQRVPDAQRPLIFSLLAAAWVVPGLVGPLLTGAIVEAASWRWVFLGVAPFVVLALALLGPSLRGTRPSSDAAYLRPATIGWAVVAALAVAVLNLAGERVEGVELVVGPLVVAVLGVAAWRLLPAGTLGLARGLPSVIGVRGAMGGSFTAAEAYLPLMLRDEHGYSPARAGAILAAASVTWALGSWVQGRMREDTDRYRLMLAGVLGYAALLGLLVVSVWASWPGWVVIVVYAAATLGVGLAYPTTSLLTMRLSPEEQIGRNSSSLQVAEALTSAFALAATGVVFGLTYSASPATAFVGTLGVSLAVASLAVLAAARARPVAGTDG